MSRNRKVNEMCVAQTCCRMCPIGQAAHRIALDCRQYQEIFPEQADKLAEEWREQNV